jgi:hypothetical protein
MMCKLKTKQLVVIAENNDLLKTWFRMKLSTGNFLREIPFLKRRPLTHWWISMVGKSKGLKTTI